MKLLFVTIICLIVGFTGATPIFAKSQRFIPPGLAKKLGSGWWFNSLARSPWRRVHSFRNYVRWTEETWEDKIPDQRGCGVLGESDDQETIEHVVGGGPVSPNRYPWMVQVIASPKDNMEAYICAGSMVTHRWVLTALHCLDSNLFKMLKILKQTSLENEDFIQPMEVVSSDGGVRIPVKRLVVPSDINIHLALVELEEELPVTTICLPPTFSAPRQPSQVTVPEVGEYCTQAGWGYINESLPILPDGLQEAEVPVVPVDRCSYFKDFDPDEHLCAGDVTSACRGDSGAPLMCASRKSHLGQGRLYVGAVNMGGNATKEAFICGNGSPAIYSRIDSHMNWIVNTVR